MASTNAKPQAIQLFKTKHGSVHAVVIGPEIGWLWRRVKYYRYQRSTTVPSGWDEVTDNWGRHNASLIKCANEVQHFLDKEQEAVQQVEHTWLNPKT